MYTLAGVGLLQDDIELVVIDDFGFEELSL